MDASCRLVDVKRLVVRGHGNLSMACAGISCENGLTLRSKSLGMSRAFRLLVVSLSALLVACSPTKFVHDGECLLEEVRIVSDTKEVKGGDMKGFVRQQPNSKWFSLVKIPLYTYSLSGRDSAKLFNKFLRRIGEPPVIYDEGEAERSREEIEKAVRNLGYIRATVDKEVNVRKGKRLELTYAIKAGRPYVVDDVRLEVADTAVRRLIENDAARSLLHAGMNFDINVLEAERQRIAALMNNSGYYRFNKDFVSFTADTVADTYAVGLTCRVRPYAIDSTGRAVEHPCYKLRNVYFMPGERDTLDNFFEYGGYGFMCNGKPVIKPVVLADNAYVKPGDIYDDSQVQRTYQSLGRLPALRSSNIHFAELSGADSLSLDCYIILHKNKAKSLSLEVEGTNSAGDFGAAASVTFQHRNIFRGSETFSVKLRGAYEAISGLTDGYMNDNYTEYGVEASLNFPRFLMPFLSSDFKRHTRATSEVGLMYTNQLRPEFERTLASVSWRYRWRRGSRFQHRIDLVDINYVYVPWISPSFKAQLEAETSSVLKYSYENLFILRTAYNLTFNSRGFNQGSTSLGNDSYTVRFGLESAGNLLYGISKAAKLDRVDGNYSIFGIPYAQYVKGDFDFVKNVSIDERNTFVFHVGLGMAYPYANSEILPFEKRYFSGGANSVRGWSVRSLGPGSFQSGGRNIDFMLQSGDIKLDMNVEYRTKLFWKLQGAVYVDAGNIWTFRDYVDQPGGQFRFNRFYKEIAVSYGLGIRLDFDFFVLRFDTGMKAVNPAGEGKDRYPLVHPSFRRDFAFHFAVGYPF